MRVLVAVWLFAGSLFLLNRCDRPCPTGTVAVSVDQCATVDTQPANPNQ